MEKKGRCSLVNCRCIYFKRWFWYSWWFRNPAPDRWFIPPSTRFYTSQLRLVVYPIVWRVFYIRWLFGISDPSKGNVFSRHCLQMFCLQALQHLDMCYNQIYDRGKIPRENQHTYTPKNSCPRKIPTTKVWSESMLPGKYHRKYQLFFGGNWMAAFFWWGFKLMIKWTSQTCCFCWGWKPLGLKSVGSSPGGVALAEALRHNRTLQDLLLRTNQLGDAGRIGWLVGFFNRPFWLGKMDGNHDGVPSDLRESKFFVFFGTLDTWIYDCAKAGWFFQRLFWPPYFFVGIWDPQFLSKRDLQKLVRCDCFGGVLAKESFPAILGLGQQSNFTATWQVLLHGRYF